MNKKQFAKRKLAEWQERLHLTDWVVKLRLYKRLPLEEQYCLDSPSEKAARIGLNIEQQTEDELEHALAHELAHLLIEPENRVFCNLVETLIPKNQRDAWFEQFNLAQNEGIESWLRLVYSLLEKPYPPYRKEASDE